MKANWQKLLEDLAKSVKSFPQDVIEILRAPQADPRTTILVLSILIVGLLLLAVLGLALSSLFRRRRAVEPIEETLEAPIPSEVPEAPEVIIERRRDWIFGVIVSVIVVIILLGTASFYTSMPSFCIRCHVVRKDYKSWAGSSHREVGCLACHQEPGISGYVVQKADYLREAFLFFTNNYDEPLLSMVSNGSCNRCHRSVANGTVTRHGIRVRHKDFLDRGYKCVYCHNTIAHGDNVPVPKFPTMDKCVLCHDNKRASAECKLCHVEEAIGEAREPRREFVKIATEIPWHCRGCHTLEISKKCIDCHGLEMPHSPEFKSGKHARLGFTQKSICWRCHPSNFGLCNKCHVYPSPHGSESEWIRLHGPAAKKTIIVEVFLEDSQFIDCYLCHDRPNMCDACHVGQKEVRMSEIRGGL